MTSNGAHHGFSSVLMPADYLQGVGKNAIIYTFLISGLFIACCGLVKRWSNKGSGSREQENEDKATTLLNGFQLTNLMINLGLGCYGIYWWFLVLPKGCPDSDKIGHPYEMTEECLTPAFFSEFQMSYQLWSIPVCILVGENSGPMMAHHASVAVLAVMCSTLITSTRYYCVFYFGVVESSSVFLSIMNAFRSRPRWIEAMPALFACSKLLFSVTFLCMRIVLWIPLLADFFRIAWDIGTSRGEDNAIYHVLVVASFTPAFILTAMQIFWASKIVRGLVKMMSKPTDSDWHSGMSSHGNDKGD